MTIPVVTLKEHHYGTRRKVGDQYEVPGQSVLTLVKAMGWAKERDASAPAAAPISTAALTAARATPAAKRSAAPRAPRKAGASYLTRDMTAQPPAGVETKDEAPAAAEPATPATSEAPPAAIDAAE